MTEQNDRLYEFAGFQVEVNERRLKRGQEIVPLTPKAFDTLLVLLRHTGKIVEKDTLLKEVWTDTFVSEATLAQNISTLRKALVTNGNNELLIETVPSRGYRFKAEVREILREAAAENTIENGLSSGFENNALNGKTEDNAATDFVDSASVKSFGKRFFYSKSVIVVTVLILIFILAGAWVAFNFGIFKSNLAATKFKNFQINQLTSSGNVITAALSPDGNYLAYVEAREQNQVLLVKQTSGENVLEIIPPKKQHYIGLTFSPSGDSIYFVTYNRETVGVVVRKGILYKVPTLGGVAEQIAEDLDSPIEFSPDKKQIAFVRTYLQEKESALIIADADGKNERKLASRTNGERFSWVGAAWSPDGKSIACSILQLNSPAPQAEAVIIDASTGEQKFLTREKWLRIGKIGWLKDGSGMLFAGYKDNSQAPTDEIWVVSYPSGDVRLITNGTNTFSGMSLDAKSDSFVSIKTEQLTSLCFGSLENPEQVSKITRVAAEPDLFNLGLEWASENKIIYGANQNGNLDIWQVNLDGRNLKQLTAHQEAEYFPVATFGGEHIVYLAVRSGVTNLWRMNGDRTNQKQLTSGYGITSPSIPNDSKWIYFSGSFDEQQNSPSLWKIPIEGGAPVQIISGNVLHPKVSPDGAFVAGYFPEVSASNPSTLKLTVFSAENGEAIKQFAENFSATQLAPIEWTADNRNLVYVKPTLEGNKLKMQPLSETESRFVRQYVERVFRFAISKTGNKFVCKSGVLINDAFLIREFRQK